MNGLAQQHHLPQDVITPGNPKSRPSRAYWAINPAHRLVIFVHGFRGKAVPTWNEFPALLPADPVYAGLDIIYYGYDGARTRADNSAVFFFELLKDLGTKPAQLINAALPPGAALRPANFTYKKITIVAHSLGAVISRRAILYAVQKKATWRKKIRLAFFAPAHMGSDIVDLYIATLAFFIPKGSVIPRVLKAIYPVLKDLDVGSPTLVQLLTDVTSATAKGNKNRFLLARKVIRGTRDRVVTPLPFGSDAVPNVLPGKGHINVCKPTIGFLDPVTLLANEGLL